jgi:hypothetical protein
MFHKRMMAAAATACLVTLLATACSSDNNNTNTTINGSPIVSSPTADTTGLGTLPVETIGS